MLLRTCSASFLKVVLDATYWHWVQFDNLQCENFGRRLGLIQSRGSVIRQISF